MNTNATARLFEIMAANASSTDTRKTGVDITDGLARDFRLAANKIGVTRAGLQRAAIQLGLEVICRDLDIDLAKLRSIDSGSDAEDEDEG